MTRSALPFATAVLLGAFAPAALAQGTAEQREACAPDAVRLCQDTIPDVDRTTACMKRHEAELTARCRRVFSAAIGETPAGPARERRATRAAPYPDEDVRERRSARAPYSDDDVPDRRESRGYPDDVGRSDSGRDDLGRGAPRYRYLAPNGDEAESGADDDVERARAAIGRLCDDDRLDPGTCAATRNGLEYAR